MDSLTKAQTARRLLVNASTITRRVQRGLLPTTKDGRIPLAAVEALEQQIHAYGQRFGDTVRAVEMLTERLGHEKGLADRRALEVARELVAIGDEWNARINAGAPPEADVELRESFAGRLALLGVIAEHVTRLTALAQMTPGLLPPTPRHELMRLSVVVGQMEPDRAAEVIGAMDDETVSERLSELQKMMTARPAANTTAPTGAEE